MLWRGGIKQTLDPEDVAESFGDSQRLEYKGW